MTPTRRASPTRWRGRTLIVMALLAFIGTSVIVVWRRSRGSAEEQIIADLDQQKRDLLARQALLESELRDAMSAERIEPAAQRRLGLRRATDSQLVTLSRQSRGAAVVDSP